MAHLFVQRNEEYVNIDGDVMLLELCEKFGVEEAYSHLIAVGITYSLLKDLTDEDINDILPKGAIRVIFRREWKKWCVPEEPPEPHVCHEVRSATQHKKKMMRVWTSVELEDILKCPNGERLRQTSTNKGFFERRHQTLLCRTIVSYAVTNSIHLSTDIIAQISEEIQDIFPHEKKETYYQQKSKLNPSYKGMLYDRYHNRNKDGGKKPKTTKKDSTIDQRDAQALQGSDEENHTQHAETNIQSTTEIAKSDEITSDTIQDWKNSSTDRVTTIKTCPEADVLVQWPLYKHPDGYKLIATDFDQIYPDTQNIDTKWLEFFEKIIPYYETNVKDSYCRSLYDDALAEKNTDKRQRLLILILHAVLQPRKRVRRPAQNKVRCMKPTIAGSQDSMLIVVMNEEDLGNRLQKLEKYLKSTQRTFHPVIFHQEDIGYVVYCTKNLRYNMCSLRDAVDLCFKAHHVFMSGIYPIESGSVWYFIQNYLYGLVTEKDGLYVGHCDKLLNFFLTN
ncbi:hypothetical protein DMENIID0001_041020 [Sergentomyia squamirostris]